jgi:phosphate uptake regulator
MGELRKVQQTPTGTFFVCLPRDWAKENGLKKGIQVSLEVTADGKLLVDSKYDVEPQPRTAILTVGPYLGREIVGRYLLGYDVIRIEAKERIDSAVRNLVKSTADSLAGLMIVEETASMISLQCLMQQQPSTSPQKILQRNHGSAARMIRDAVTSFVNGDLDLAKNVIERDVENNKFYFLLVRILRTIIQNPRLSEKLGISPIECLDYRLAASLIEGIGDACVQVASNTISLKGVKCSDTLRKLLFEMQSACYDASEQALKAFLTKDISAAENIRKQKGKIEQSYSNVERAAKETSVDLIPQILAVVSFLRQIYERSVDMADLVA